MTKNDDILLVIADVTNSNIYTATD